MEARRKEALGVMIIALVGVILALAAWFVIDISWPTEIRISSSVLVGPVAFLIIALTFLAIIKVTQKTLPDGTPIWHGNERRALIVLFGVAVGIAILMTSIILCRELLGR